jgi:hypothetical protein
MSSNKKRPKVIAFDVIETLFSLAPIADRFESIGLFGASLPLFFSRMLRDAFALEISGVYKSFKEVAAGTLEVLLQTSGVPPGSDKIQSIHREFLLTASPRNSRVPNSSALRTSVSTIGRLFQGSSTLR